MKIEIDLKILTRLRMEGKTTKEAANYFGVSTQTIKRRGWNKLPNPFPKPKYTTDKSYFENINTKDKAYILGFICADGCIYENGLLRIEVKTQDDYILSFIRDRISPNNKIKKRTRKRKVKGYEWTSNTSTLSIKSKSFVKDLQFVEVVPNKTYKEVSVPILPQQMYPHFIRGYFDGDGCICKVITNKIYKRKDITFTGNPFFIESLRDFLKTNGIVKSNSKITKLKNNFAIQWKFSGKKDVERLYKYMYNHEDICFLKRKHDLFI